MTKILTRLKYISGQYLTTPLVQWTGGIQPGEKPGEKSPKNQEPGEKQPDFRSTRWKTKVVANPVKISMNKAQPGENSTCRLSPVIIPCDPVKILVRYHSFYNFSHFAYGISKNLKIGDIKSRFLEWKIEARIEMTK